MELVRMEDSAEAEKPSESVEASVVSPPANAAVAAAPAPEGVVTRDRRVRKAKAFNDEFVSFKSPPKSIISAIKQEPVLAAAEAADELDDVKYAVADIAWAKVGSHPWWPCLVVAPGGFEARGDDGAHLRLVGNPQRPKRLVHVEFLDTAMAHAWVPRSNLLLYGGVDALKALAQERLDQAPTKSAKDRVAERYSLKVSASKQEAWDKAIVEADELLKMTHDERRKALIKKHEEAGAAVSYDPSESEDQESLNGSGSQSISRKRKAMDDSGMTDTNSETSNDNQTSETSETRQPTRTSSRKSMRREAPEPDASEGARKSKRHSVVPSAKNKESELDEQTLVTIKNQLFALTLLPSNLKELPLIAKTLGLTEASLAKQYFGFESDLGDDQVPQQADFLRRVASVAKELESKSIGRPPRAVLSLKHDLPMVYVELLSLFSEAKAKSNPYDFATNQEDAGGDAPAPYSAASFHEDLFELSKRLTASRADSVKLEELIAAMKASIASKVS